VKDKFVPHPGLSQRLAGAGVIYLHISSFLGRAALLPHSTGEGAFIQEKCWENDHEQHVKTEAEGLPKKGH